MLGIGITSHNRPELLKTTLNYVKKNTPGAKIVIVDDASTVPVKDATYRFETNVGIARAKNKCIELLQDCDHIFLLDDDCYPVKPSWWKPYVESPEPHLMYIFENPVNKVLGDCKLIYESSKLKAYSHARGCMLYLDMSILKHVGGMDENYNKWGYEHGDWSNRIHNLGYTSFRYADIPDSNKLIFSGDEQGTVKTSVDYQHRNSYLRMLRSRYQQSFTSEMVYPIAPRDIVLTCYYTGKPDPQRNSQWQADYSKVTTLRDSLLKLNLKMVLLHDCFDEDDPSIEMVRVETSENPYFQRWLDYYQYLRDHDVDRVFCVDATDVDFIKNPFEYIEPGYVYSGDEPGTLKNNWLLANHKNYFLQHFMQQNYRTPLLNAGVVGGSKKDIMSLAHKISRLYFDNNKNLGVGDMPAYNYIMRTYFNDRIKHGRDITTVFKAYEQQPKSYIRHK